MGRRVILASASVARLRVLRGAGIEPEVIVSGVDEDDVDTSDVEKLVVALAERKALAVASTAAASGALVIGCDSVLEFEGNPRGKPSSPANARDQWIEMRGKQGTLLTGHCIVDTVTGAQVSDVAATAVRFGSPTDEEIDAYVESGEPLGVAGAFTLDGRSAAFIDGIDGDPSNVIGLSMPLLRRLLSDLDVEFTSLWR